ncbi:Ig-like domain-containing protein [Clostridium sp. Marseille-P2415]|uniref:Ig-like domain-containing protein n=1 Tax=Clostridium sp. Marseille-P2415 TaxID=1805471 RepID=UPI00098833B0|nr:Ig-like domain-containing protein [Clostridium sp. Marseille-P2415]
MKKKSLLKIAAVIYLMVSVLFFGQISAFADEIKPIHEYNFDSDIRTIVVDTGSQVKDATSIGKNHETFFTGYDGKGKARYFNGTDDHLVLGNLLPVGAKSIRFKMKKDASTVSDKLEAILSNNSNNVVSGYFIGIGSEMLNHRGGKFPDLTARMGTLYIASYYSDSALNYEIQTPESVCDGKWHDILLTWDGTTNTNSVKLYLDDMTTPVAQATAAYTTDRNIYGTSLLAGQVPGQFVEGGYDTGEKFWYNGYLDDIQIYDSAIIPEASNSDTPSNLKAVGGDSKVDLSWNTVTDATSYNLKRSTTAGGPYTTIATGVTGTSYTDKDVKNGTTYYYVVSSIVSGIESTNSNEVSAKPIAAQTPPATDAKLKVVLEVYEALQLSVDNDLDVNTEMAWTSSDETVATVNGKGVVTALAPGNTVITVKSADGSYTDYINVLVVEDAGDYRLAIDLKVGQSSRLTIDDFTNTANATWTSMDSSVAEVSGKGKVTAMSKGLALITAKDEEGNIIGRVYVRVRD